MTRIDFYIIEGDDAADRLPLACMLAEKAIDRGHRVFIHAEDADMTQSVDTALWGFRADSFVPHCIGQENPASDLSGEPVVIAHDMEPDGTRDVLINLAPDVPFFFSRFRRTLEIINGQADIRLAGRKRWNFYKDRGYPLQHHQIRSQSVAHTGD